MSKQPVTIESTLNKNELAWQRVSDSRAGTLAGIAAAWGGYSMAGFEYHQAGFEWVAYLYFGFAAAGALAFLHYAPRWYRAYEAYCDRIRRRVGDNED